MPGPYVGDYSGVLWNAQGFFMSTAAGHMRKRWFVQRLLKQRDFCVLCEAHVTDGARRGFTDLPGTQSWWSEGTAARAGVGVIVTNAFLQKFTLAEPEWLELEPGRLAVLRLWGASGCLDVVSCYMPTGRAHELHPGEATAAPPQHSDPPPAALRAQREALAYKIQGLLRPSSSLTLLAGDFNFVTASCDRWNKRTGEHSGQGDQQEAANWLRVLPQSALYELHQDEPTHEGPVTYGRLDRVYVNQSVAEQLDRRVYAAALPWTALSHHRPLAFGRDSKPVRAPLDKPIPEDVVADERWPLQVSAEFHDLLAFAGEEDNPMVRLRLLKVAMRTVAARLLDERSTESSARRQNPLQVTMAALRRLERRGLVDFPALCAKYPYLGSLLPADLRQHDPTRCLQLLREHAVELARQDALDALQRLHDELPSLNPEMAQRRRSQVLLQLKRIAPGRSTALAAVLDANGELQTSGPGMAAALRRHWASTFSARSLNGAARREWLRRDSESSSGLRQAVRSLAADEAAWKLRRSDITRAIAMTSHSAPGPDGVPYSAWRRLGALAVDVLFAAAAELSTATGTERLLAAFPLDGDHNTPFNDAVMVFIPKKFAREVNGVRCCEAGDVRPLSLVNTDNRLMANAVRLRVEPILAEAISPAQRGFLPGRSLLQNVVEMDGSMRAASLQHEHAAAVFFDFAAAFPSLAHDFMREVLLHLGLPHSFRCFVANLYMGNGCKISAGGTLHNGFSIRAGIRQGCPLSPLLFALCGDLLIRRLLEALPHDALAAYADDLGLVAIDIFTSAAVFTPLFADFASISGLQLNVRKTVFVPLGDAPLPDFKAALEAHFPGWGAAPVRLWAEYLGFVLGPEAGDRVWTKAFAKVEKRADLWAQLGLGLHFTSVAYNVYIASLLSFLLQLAVLPASWSALEAAVFRKLVPGPAQWVLPADLHDLHRSHGLPHDFRDLRDVSLAARLRVVHREAMACGGLRVSTEVRRLNALYQDTPFLYRGGRWRQWYLGSFYHNLHAAVGTCRALGVTIESIETELGAARPRPHTQAQTRRIDRAVQQAARGALTQVLRSHPERRLRHKLARWQLPVFPRIRAMRAARIVPRLRRLVAPRVLAAVLRTWYNGWCTRRRFQGRGRCVFGCGLGADSVDHYMCCSRVHGVGQRQLRLPVPADFMERGVLFMLLAASSQLSDETLVRRALLLTAAYRLHCAHRREQPFADEGVLGRAFSQALKEAAAGHLGAVRCLDSVWATTSR